MTRWCFNDLRLRMVFRQRRRRRPIHQTASYVQPVFNKNLDFDFDVRRVTSPSPSTDFPFGTLLFVPFVLPFPRKTALVDKKPTSNSL